MPETQSAQEPDAPAAYVIIRGKTADGNKFRPSDWCDRLHSSLQVLGDEAEYYSEFVQLANVESQRCLVINKELKEINERLYNFFMRFVDDNKLTTQTVSREQWQSFHNG